MSAGLALTMPQHVAGFGLLYRRILSQIAPLMATPEQLRDLRACIGHGVLDNKLTVEFARSARQLVEQQGLLPSYHEYESGHELSSRMRVDFCSWLSDAVDGRYRQLCGVATAV